MINRITGKTYLISNELQKKEECGEKPEYFRLAGAGSAQPDKTRLEHS